MGHRVFWLFLSLTLPFGYLPFAISALLSGLTCLPAGGQQLQGGIQHEEIIGSVPPFLRAGASFDSEPAVTDVVWYRIPIGLAGTFKTTFSHVTPVSDFTGSRANVAGLHISRSVQTYGRQLDALGQCWEAELLPYVQPWNMGIVRNRQVVMQKRALFANDSTLSLHIRGVDVMLTPVGNLILKTSQEDAIKTITISPDGFSVHDDVMAYSSSGRPMRTYYVDYRAKRIANFQPIESERGIDLRASLADFLRQNGRDDLIPH